MYYYTLPPQSLRGKAFKSTSRLGGLAPLPGDNMGEFELLMDRYGPWAKYEKLPRDKERHSCYIVRLSETGEYEHVLLTTSAYASWTMTCGGLDGLVNRTVAAIWDQTWTAGLPPYMRGAPTEGEVA